MNNRVRVRFAPSPTGGLHLGGVRTVLYNYLLQKHGGDFILRIEDTDQFRYVASAEDYIFQCLSWAGLEPDEAPARADPGPTGKATQSHVPGICGETGQRRQGLTMLSIHRKNWSRCGSSSKPKPTPRPSTTMPSAAVCATRFPCLPKPAGCSGPVPDTSSASACRNGNRVFDDMIRGTVSFDTAVVDDKVLLKADGMPTYHLAVVVDDYLMKITHAFRGEEWLSSAPVHPPLEISFFLVLTTCPMGPPAPDPRSQRQTK